jgi:pimeloyl-ACP methyl ester carboxylesterase
MSDLPDLQGARHRDVRVDGVRLHVAELGPDEATPLLLVHGWPQHWWCWRHVAPRLAGEFRCLMPDLRGFGWSEAPRHGYETDRLAADLVGLVDGLGLGRVGLIGHDWGAYLGMLIAMRSPQRLTRLLALSVPHPWPSRHDRLSPRRLASFGYQLPLSAPIVGEHLMRGGATRQILRRGAPQGVFTDRDLEVFDERMRSPERARVTVALYRTFLVHELPAIAAGRFRDARIPISVRLLVGERDPIIQGSDLRGFEEHTAEMTVERVSGAGHFLPEETPELVVKRAAALFGPDATH